MNQNLNSAISAYRSGAGQAHPMVAVVRLFDEVLRRIRLTIRDTEARKMEDAYINISRASLILRGLAGNLRFEHGEDLATTLQEAYVQNMIAMHTSFGKPDAVERYGRILVGLTELRNTWAGVAGMAAVGVANPAEAQPAAPATTPAEPRKAAAR